MLNLILENGVKSTDGVYTLDAAVTPVSWCITPSAIDLDATKTLINPHVIIATFDESSDRHREIDRIIVPLSQGKTYLQFHRGGLNTIRAWVVHGGTNRELRKRTTPRKLDLWCDYSCDYIDEEQIWSDADIIIMPVVNNLIVDVPEEQFAQQLPPSIMRYVNLWHHDEITDQCNLRRRLLFTMFVKIWPMMVWLLVIYPTLGALMAIISWGVGCTGLKLKPIIHPLDSNLSEITDNCSWKTNYLNKLGFTVEMISGESIKPMGFIFSPLLICFSGALAVLVNVGMIQNFAALILYFVIGVGWMGIIFSLIIATILIDANKSPGINLVVRMFNSLDDWLFGDSFSISESTNYHCPIDKTENFIAKPNFSWRLWFEEMKAKVCKPFPK